MKTLFHVLMTQLHIHRLLTHASPAAVGFSVPPVLNGRPKGASPTVLRTSRSLGRADRELIMPPTARWARITAGPRVVQRFLVNRPASTRHQLAELWRAERPLVSLGELYRYRLTAVAAGLSDQSAPYVYVCLCLCLCLCLLVSNNHRLKGPLTV